MNIDLVLPLIVGIIVFIAGIGALINPNLSRFIRLPFSTNIKAIMSIILGSVFILIGVFTLLNE